MGRLEGKVALVTGSARGQGRAHAVAMAREGADIVAVDICEQISTVPYRMATPDDLKETVAEVEALDRRVLARQVDAREQDQLDSAIGEAVTEFGGIDIVAINHGIWTRGTLWELSEQTWQDMIDTNLTGVFHAMRAVLPTMIEQRSGRIVVTSSMAGKLGFANVGHYVAAKWGVIGLAKSAAIEVAPHGVTVNVICPTNVATDMIQNSAAYKLFRPDLENPTQEDAMPGFQSLNPIPVPWVEPVDISNAMAFLCSDDARYITGETLAVAAGFNASNAG